MKESTIEQKAKAYDKLFVKAQRIYNKENDVLILHTIEDLFPELEESGDEKMRKAIGYAIGQSTHSDGTLINGVSSEEALAWLEKQGEKIEPIEGFNTEFERQISHLIASIINKEYEYTEAFVKWTSNALLNYAKIELEKQGEQKPVVDTKVIIPKFRVGDIVKSKSQPMLSPRKIISIGKDCYWCEDRGCIGFAWEDDCELVEQNTSWSEEDVAMLDSAIAFVEHSPFSTIGKGKNNVIAWLKNLKDKVLTQIK